MRKFVLYILVFVVSIGIVNAQTYNMTNTSVSSACSGTFYDAGGSGSNYSNNQNLTETFCAPAGQYLSFTFTSFNTESGYDYLYVYDGSNTSAPLIGSYSGTGSPGTINSSGNCITFVFTSDGSTTKSGWAATIACNTSSSVVAQAPCANLGFESGLSNWYGTTGTVVDGATTAPAPTYVATANNTFGTQTTVMTAGTDPIGGFSKVFAGAQSIRLGDGTGTGSLGASIEQYFQVTSANSNFTYNYAVVLEDGGHPNYQQPFFMVQMWDQNGNPIACANYLITAPGTGFVLAPASSGYTDVYYKTWTPVSVNLISYIGQNVRVRFTSGDCTQSGHFGYAYIDCSCAPYTINTPTICVGQSATLTAPSGALNYSWTPGGATTSSITVSPGSTTNYTCTLTSQGTTPCTGILTTTVTVIPTPTITVNTATVCSGSSVSLTANGATTYSWTPSTGLSATTGSVVSANPTSNTTYSIVGTTGTCSSSKTTTVTVSPTPTVTTTNSTICAGGTATLTASGATTYSWVSGTTPTTGSVVTASPGATTSYTVTGTTNTCTNSAIATITVNTPPTLTVTNASICNGAGPATLGVSGASTYTWSGGGITGSHSTAPSDNPASTTIYTVNGTGANTCTATATGTISVISTPTISVNSGSICKSQTSLLLTANSNATSFVWSPATGLSGTTGNSVTASPTSTQVYTIVGTAGTCTVSTTATVTVNTPPTLTVTGSTICLGQQTGSLTASGASTYTWSGGGISGNTSSNPTDNPGSTTVYTVNASDVNTCTATATGTITVNTPPTLTVTNASICNGAGPATLGVNGASTYTWSGGGITGSHSTAPSDNPASTTIYTVNGTAANSCTATATGTINVISNPTITVNSEYICKSQTNIILTASSNATSFVWSPSTGLSGTTGSSVTASPTSTQVYTIVGTAGTCTVSTTATVTVNTPPTLTVTGSTICLGQQTGSLTVSGASTYTWSGGGISGNTSSTPTDNPASTTVYTVSASDVNTCTATATGTITVNTPPTLTVTSASICNGAGPASMGVSGASTYTWSGGGITGSHSTAPSDNPASTTIYTVNGTGANTCTTTATGTITVISTPTISVNSGSICKSQTSLLLTANSNAATFTWSPATGLSGTTGNSVTASPTSTQVYTIVGTAGTCTVSTTTTVTVNAPPTLTVTGSTICLGQQTGSLTASGASTYTWSGGGISGNTSSTPTDNPAVTTPYTVTATDINTCTATTTGTITVNTPPTLTVTNASICNGAGPATLGVSGASTYTWSGGGITGSNATAPSDNPASTTIYTVNGTAANTCTATATGTITVISNPTLTVVGGAICAGQQTITLTANSNAATFVWSPATGLSGTTGNSVTANPASTQVYTIVGTAGTCTVSTTITVTVNAPPTLTVTSSTICIGQQTGTLNIGGANTYTWSGGGITGSNATSPTDNPTNTTIYTVNATDVNTCTATATGTITVNQLPNVTATSTSVCPNYAGTITAGGANTYTWSAGATTGANLTQTPVTTTDYTVTGTDANTCTNTAVGTIFVYNNFSISVNSASICAAGQQTATLTATGASTYVWAPATGLNVSTGSVVTSTPAATTQVYTITGTSAVGNCTATTTSTLTINALPVPTATSNTPCASQQALTLNCSPNGLTTYSWLGPNSFTSSVQNPTIATASVTAAAAGVYTVVVVDANQCTNSTTVNVTVNPLPVVTASAAPVCVNQSIQLTASGGVSYSWSGQSGLYTSSVQNPIIPNATTTMSGVYVVTVTDVNGCVNANVAQVVVNNTPTVTVNSSTICIGQQTATLTASGASTYSWSPSNTLNSSTGAIVSGYPSSTTIYTVTGISSVGCVSTATASVVVNALPVVITNTIAPDCIPLCTSFSATSTPAASSYNWSFGNGMPNSTLASPTQCFTLAGTYQVKVIVTDIHGCTGTAGTPVQVFALPTADFDYGQQPVSILAPEVQFTNQSTPGLPHYSWNFGDVYGTDTSSLFNPSHTYNNVGTYYVTLTVSTASGCSATVVKPVVINEDYAIYVPNAFSPNGDGVNEIFKAEGEGIKDFKLYIFDRWGLLIFYSDDINKGWDGRVQGTGSVDPVQEDVYVWKIEATDYAKKGHKLHGTVTLLK